ncbi:unnamed protein product [Alopecurus aequalis]
MAGRWLSAVSEESADIDDFMFTAAYPPSNFYRGLIRRVAVSGGLIRSTLFSQYGYGSTASTYSSQSGASSYPSNNSGYSSAGSAHAASGARALCDLELREIARRMVRDRYTQRMVHAFQDAPNEALGRWFSELDVDWVLQLREGYGLPELEAGSPESSFQDFVERWIRALAIIVLSMREMHLMTIDELTVASARFGKASILAMLAVVDAIVVPADPKGHGPGDRLWAVLNMYVCVSDASSFKWSRSRRPIPQETQSIMDEINASLSAEENRLNGAIFRTMAEVTKFMEEEDSWTAEIPRGAGSALEKIGAVLRPKLENQVLEGRYVVGRTIPHMLDSCQPFTRLTSSRSSGRSKALNSDICCGKLSLRELFQATASTWRSIQS